MNTRISLRWFLVGGALGLAIATFVVNAIETILWRSEFHEFGAHYPWEVWLVPVVCMLLAWIALRLP